jgi:hypothetical protein
MNANARAARAAHREMIRTTRARRLAIRAVASGEPQSARTHLLAVGFTARDAKRFAPAFSRGLRPADYTVVVKKLKGRRTAIMPAKRYDPATFRARLAVYRPKDPAAAARFDTAATFALAA